MISDEAVEAAATVILRGVDEGHHAYKIAYAALEAAAPYMLREAKADAYEEGFDRGAESYHLDNPYRSQP